MHAERQASSSMCHPRLTKNRGKRRIFCATDVISELVITTKGAEIDASVLVAADDFF